MVVCSRCGEIIKSGWDYRWHFDQHLDEFDNAEDKQEYVKQTTKILNDKIVKIMSKNSHKTRYEQLMQWLPTLSSKRNKPVKRSNNNQNWSKADAYKQR